MHWLEIEGSVKIDSDRHRIDSNSDSDGFPIPFMRPPSYDFS